MHKFYITCKCIKSSAIYGLEEGKVYSGQGHVSSDGLVDYLIRVPNNTYGPQFYKCEWFGQYFQIISAS